MVNAHAAHAVEDVLSISLVQVVASSKFTEGVGKLIALVIVGALFSAVCFILRPHGPIATLCTVGLICSLVSTQLLMKELASPPFSFDYPGWVTVLHFATVWLVCVVYWLVKGESHKALPSSMGSLSRYTNFILPIALSLPLSVVFNNTALIYLGAGLNSIVATLSPVTTAALANIMGRKVAKFAWVGVCMACLGAGVIAWGKLSHGQASGAVACGLLFSLASVLLRSIKVVLQDNLMNPSAYARKGSEKQPLKQAMPVDPMHVWALQGLPCVVISVIYAAFTENFFAFATALEAGTSLLVLATCVSACVLNLLGMFVIKQIGGASMQILGKLNTIMVVAFSVAFLRERLQPKVILGTCLICVGVGIFEYAEHKERERESREARAPILPAHAAKTVRFDC
jgi:drug/metabolite transporter (DMT)-like permease